MLAWLSDVYLEGVEQQLDIWTRVHSLLSYLDSSVFLTATVCHGQASLAFKTFVSYNSTGRPLTQLDLLKALMVQNLRGVGRDADRIRTEVLGPWELLNSDAKGGLIKLAADLAKLEKTKPWHTIVAGKGVCGYVCGIYGFCWLVL